MKGFGVALFCLVVAVQGRNLDVDGLSGSPAQLGENPWLVHLRVTKLTGGGLLSSSVGSLIGSSWVLTAASAVQDARFVWIRYGAVDPIRPELVTETSTVRIHPEYNAATGENNVALVSINRIVQPTDNIKPVTLAAAGSEIPSSGRLCGFGGENNIPGERLQCLEADLTVEGETITAKGTGSVPSEFDIGSPLVSDGVQYGVLSSVDGTAPVYLKTSLYRAWIQEVTGTIV
ncbi:trypsin-like [Pararge aegeria]|uniref:Jg1343 protein n=1 Tax=Pararge aegeria aegeria TaxID=348720 RepID=A0A8S4S5K4_9NEOP|nr:trypsin-like [Pararge aegeria]CAH2244688.1 jg1343 [Pararge aegeria aegeria]